MIQGQDNQCVSQTSEASGKETDKSRHLKAAVYGGNGFVGTRICKQLSRHGVCTVALSRSGHKPLHITNMAWSESVRWCKGDASEPDTKLLSSIDVVVLLVGSPPLPTFSDQSFEQQLFMNGTTNVNAINAAADAGVKNIILLGASIPWPLNTDKFAYAKGKRLAFDAAQAFANLSSEHSATVLQPGAVYGKRHLRNGKVIPLDWLMAPISKLMPWQFVSVDRVAERVASIAIDNPKQGKFTVIKNRQI